MIIVNAIDIGMVATYFGGADSENFKKIIRNLMDFGVTRIIQLATDTMTFTNTFGTVVW